MPSRDRRDNAEARAGGAPIDVRVLAELPATLRARLVVIIANAGREREYGVTVRSDKLVAAVRRRSAR